jgi:hypothetical protein
MPSQAGQPYLLCTMPVLHRAAPLKIMLHNLNLLRIMMLLKFKF